MKLLISSCFALFLLQGTAVATKNLRGNKGSTVHPNSQGRRLDGEDSDSGSWDIIQTLLISDPQSREGEGLTVPKFEAHHTTEERIVGGSSTDEGEIPYFVDLYQVGCGGTLIAPQVVLTAHHCDKDNDRFVGEEVIVGAYEDNSDDHGAVKVEVDDQVGHPDYEQDEKINDFLLLKLKEPVYISKPLASISDNDDRDFPSADTELRVTGLGRTSAGGDSPGWLRDVEVPVVDVDDCRDLYAKAWMDVDPDTMFCAGDVDDGGIDSCQGDSGGPIVFEKNDDVHILMGVVSWGKGCAREGFPGVYAKVGSAYSWIKEEVCDNWELEADFCNGGVTGGSDNSGGSSGDDDGPTPSPTPESEEESSEGGDSGDNLGDSLPDCEEVSGYYETRYGHCDSYAEGKRNHEFCSQDEDDNGIKVKDACSECGLCVGGSDSPQSDDEDEASPEDESSPEDASSPDESGCDGVYWDIGYGPCESGP